MGLFKRKRKDLEEIKIELSRVYTEYQDIQQLESTKEKINNLMRRVQGISDRKKIEDELLNVENKLAIHLQNVEANLDKLKKGAAELLGDEEKEQKDILTLETIEAQLQKEVYKIVLINELFQPDLKKIMKVLEQVNLKIGKYIEKASDVLGKDSQIIHTNKIIRDGYGRQKVAEVIMDMMSEIHKRLKDQLKYKFEREMLRETSNIILKQYGLVQ